MTLLSGVFGVIVTIIGFVIVVAGGVVAVEGHRDWGICPAYNEAAKRDMWCGVVAVLAGIIVIYLGFVGMSL